jgi:nitrogen fixation/metabolism regulation signal transduction histidine kinase
MEFRREIVASFGIMIGMVLVMSLNAVLLASRLGPAIGQTMDENIASIRGAVTVIELASRAPTRPAEDRDAAAASAAAAIEALRGNVTEAAELPVLEVLAAEAPRAVRGEIAALDPALSSATSLIDVNIAAMARHGAEAQRLGAANAWAAVFAGVIAFLISRVIGRRLRRRIVAPIAELREVLDRAHHGDHLRRCESADAAADLGQIMRDVNRLLDDRLLRDRVPAPPSDRAAAQAVLLALLDAEVAPCAVIDPKGEIVAANHAMLARLADPDGLALRDALRTGEGPDIASRQPLAGDIGWRVTLTAGDELPT